MAQTEAVNWLSNNLSHIVLISWGGTASSNSVFADKKRNIIFTEKFFIIKQYKKTGRLIAPTKQEVNNKKRKTMIERYGVEQTFQFEDFNKKRKKTYKKRYGVENPFSSELIQKKIKDTNYKKYGVDIPSKSEQIKQKIIEAGIKSGRTKIINGKTIKQLSVEKNISYSVLNVLYRKTNDEEIIISYQKQQTIIEKIIQDFLERNCIPHKKDKLLKKTNYRPDFLIPDKKIIIECDGLYWHSDVYKSKTYHYIKKQEYNKLGFRPLFFRENEILDKPEIVKSIIANALGIISQKIHGRKTHIEVVNKIEGNKFFEHNHLMGSGSGRIYGLYTNNKKLVACMQVKWKNKKSKVLEISRFCSLNNHVVVGGFGKLLTEISSRENPNKIMTYIDQRYGEGKYLDQFGFHMKKNNVSFSWTNRRLVIHRLRFPGNSGYDVGFNKIWDCGQALFVKENT